MAGTGTLNLNLLTTVDSSTRNPVLASTLTMTGSERSELIQSVNDTGAALNVGAVGTVGLLIARVLTGTAAGTVSFYRDAGFTQAIATAVAQNQIGVLLANPGTIYAKASTGATIRVEVIALPQ